MCRASLLPCGGLGYLLQHKLASVLENPGPGGTYPHNWYIEAEEVPVSLPNGDETRVDLLLRHGPEKKSPWRAVIESKRSSKDFKRWVFFGQTSRYPSPSFRKYYIEYATLRETWNQSDQSEPPMIHSLKDYDALAECDVFDYGIEARIDRDRKASATNAIEDALRQVTLGQAGIAGHLRRTRELHFRLIPVVATTAELYAANFSCDNVLLDSGTINAADLSVQSRDWLAVNYRISDVISQMSRFSTNLSSDIGAHLSLWQVRTVFIVRATHIQQFLQWLGTTFCFRP